jgi:integrase
MSVRKRSWVSGGEERSAWIVDYFDQEGKRRQETFARKKEADARWLEVGHEVREGTHTARGASITVAEAAALWLQAAGLNNLERSTTAQYESHVTLHINPLIGRAKLADLTTPRVQRFADDLLTRPKADDPGETVSRSTARKVLASLKGIIKHAQRQGQIAKNPAQPVSIRVSKRGTAKLKAGRDFPSKPEINVILQAASGRWRPLLITAVFTGMRSSELRGLRWEDVDLDAKLIHVRQRADAWGTMGAPKSEAGERTIPMTPMVVNALREWRLTCPHRDRGNKGEGDPGVLELVFPTSTGVVEYHANIMHRGFHPLQVACGMTRPTGETDDEGQPILRAKYGLHTLRHFFASWLIDQGISLKKVQGMLGHATMAMTADTYGHLFPDLENDAAKMAEGERELLGPKPVSPRH